MDQVMNTQAGSSKPLRRKMPTAAVILFMLGCLAMLYVVRERAWVPFCPVTLRIGADTVFVQRSDLLTAATTPQFEEALKQWEIECRVVDGKLMVRNAVLRNENLLIQVTQDALGTNLDESVSVLNVQKP